MTPLMTALIAWGFAILGTTIGVTLLVLCASKWFPAKQVQS